MKKRIMALLLSGILVFSQIVPVTADFRAEEPTEEFTAETMTGDDTEVQGWENLGDVMNDENTLSEYVDDVTYYQWDSDSNGLVPATVPDEVEVVEISEETVIWNEGWYVVNTDVTISNRITVNGDVHLILAEDGNLFAKQGIHVSSGNSLTIYGQDAEGGGGTVTATTGIGSYEAGIGGNERNTGGTISIHGGIVQAESLYRGAGIGGGAFGDGGTITIYGGVVKAISDYGAGIGGGAEENGGEITIYGGAVETTSAYGAGIGGGAEGNGGEITIYGGAVETTSAYGAGIGGGKDGSGGTITIYGGSVQADSRSYGAGIGGGLYKNGGIISISGGVVTAVGGAYGAGIGGGFYEEGGIISISGGVVTAVGGDYGAGIGGGKDGTAGTFSTGQSGTAVIFTNDIADSTGKSDWNGVIFQGEEGKVYGTEITPGIDFEIPAGKTLTIDPGKTLTVAINTILTNRGTIILQQDTTTPENSGKLSGNGRIRNYGTILPSDEIEGVIPASETAVRIAVKPAADGQYGEEANPATACFGDTIRITAVSKKKESEVSQTALLGTAEINTADIYVEDGENKELLRKGVTVSKNGDTYTATAEITINDTDNKWQKGDNRITVEFGGYGTDLMDSVGTAVLTVLQPTLSAPVIHPDGGYFIGSQKVSITCEEADTAIYYTTDGSEPGGEAGTLYIEPFTIDRSMTVKAVAVKENWNDSPVVSAEFTKYTPIPPAPEGEVTNRPGAENPDIPTTGTTKPVQPDTGGDVPIEDGTVKETIEIAERDAEKNGYADNGVAVEVPVKMATDQDTLHIHIKGETLDRLVEESVKKFTITTSNLANIAMNQDAIRELDELSEGGDVILHMSRVNSLSGDAAEAIGSRPVYSMTKDVVKDGVTTPMTDLSEHGMEVSLPYIPSEGEETTKLYGVYVDEAGKPHWLSPTYDAKENTVVMEMNQSGIYGVGYLNLNPTPVRVTGKTTSTVEVAWEKEVLAEGYSIWYHSEFEDENSRKIVTGEDTLTWTHKRLTPGVKHFYMVRPWVETAEGYVFGDISNFWRGTTKPEAAEIETVKVAEGKVKVILAGEADGARKYSMCYSSEKDFSDFKVGIRTSCTVRTFQKALKKGTYYVRVKSYRDIGNNKRIYGDWSNQARITVK